MKRRSQTAALPAATPPGLFRVHYSDGTQRFFVAPDPTAARKSAKRPGAIITKVKRDRTGGVS